MFIKSISVCSCTESWIGATHLSTGVPQGSILGPLTFPLYNKDLPSGCSIYNIQMYVDDTVIYVHGGSLTPAANDLTDAMVHVTAWLQQCCLPLNVSETVCMCLNKPNTSSASGEKLHIVSNFRFIIDYMSTESAQMYMHSVVLFKSRCHYFKTDTAFI